MCSCSELLLLLFLLMTVVIVLYVFGCCFPCNVTLYHIAVFDGAFVAAFVFVVISDGDILFLRSCCQIFLDIVATPYLFNEFQS